jgi:hypothetical protein
MQKLSGTSSGKNNNNCGIFHHGSNKIEIAVFWIFYDFLRNLQESAKHMYYLRFFFCTPAPDRFSRFTNKSLIHKKLPATFLKLAMWPLRHGGRRRRPKFRRSGAGIGRGKGLRGGEALQGRFRHFVGAVEAPAGSHGGGDRGEPLYPLFRRGCGRAKEWGGSGSFWRGRWRSGGTAQGVSKNGGRRPALQWRRRGTGAHGKTDRGLILERAGKGRGQISRWDVLGQLIPPVRRSSLGRRAPAGARRRTAGLCGARPSGEGGDSTCRGCGLQGSRSAPCLGKERPWEARAAQTPRRRASRAGGAGSLSYVGLAMFDRVFSIFLNRSAQSDE